MGKIRIALFSLIFLAGLVGCAGHDRNIVVLTPNPDGSTGRIVVSNPSGNVEITQPYQATRIRNPNTSPSKPETMAQSQIQAIFADAMAIEPKPPIHFILYFEKNSDTLTPDSINELPQILKTISARNSVDVAVIGHADTVGSQEYNMKLSIRRAEAVSRLLIGKGVNPSFLAVSSHGKENPLIKTGDNVSEPRNRRVEVVVR